MNVLEMIQKKCLRFKKRIKSIKTFTLNKWPQIKNLDSQNQVAAL